MSPLRVHPVFAILAAAAFAVAGCSTPSTKQPSPPTAETAETDPAAQARAEFQHLVERLLRIEPALTNLLDQIAARLDKPAQIALERELLDFFKGESFAAALRNQSFFTAPRLLEQFTPETARALKTAGLDRSLLNLIDDLAGLSVAVGDAAAASDDGRALQQAFGLIHREVLPALVEIRALVTEELLDSNEAATLTQKVEEQLQSIDDQLASLRSRAQSVSTPTPPPL